MMVCDISLPWLRQGFGTADYEYIKIVRGRAGEMAHRQRACYAEFDPCQKPTIPVLERQRQEDPCSFVGQASEMNR